MPPGGMPQGGMPPPPPPPPGWRPQMPLQQQQEYRR
jgi:hypothetical protein